MSLTHSVTIMEKAVRALRSQEEQEVRRRLSDVLSQLLEEVETFHESMSYNSFVQNRCAMSNMERDPVGREFWGRPWEAKKWRCMEKVPAHYVWCKGLDGGVGMADPATLEFSKMQLVSCQ